MRVIQDTTTFVRHGGWAWPSYRLSAVDVSKFNTRFREFIQWLKDNGRVIQAVEIGNEPGWASFNGDFPIGGSIRVYDQNVNGNDSDLRRIQSGFRKLGECVEKAKRAVEDIYVGENVQILLGGLNNPDSRYVASVQASYSPPEEVYRILKGTSPGLTDYTQFLDGVGVHFYPQISSPFSSDTARQNIKTEISGVMTPLSPLLRSHMPIWITEFGFSQSSLSEANRLASHSWLVRSLSDPDFKAVNWDRSYLFGFDIPNYQVFSPTTGQLLPTGQLFQQFATSGGLDATPPAMAWVSPVGSSTYTSPSTVVVEVTATDNVGVTRVCFARNGVVVSTQTTAGPSYSYSWPVTEADYGSHTWTVTAYDLMGNQTTTAALGVTIDIKPDPGKTIPLGVGRANLFWFPTGRGGEVDQLQLLEKMKASGINRVRLNWNRLSDANYLVGHIKKCNELGLEVLLFYIFTNQLASENYPPTASTVPVIGDPWGTYKMSDVDENLFSNKIKAFMTVLKSSGCVIRAVEIGPEPGWAPFNGDFPQGDGIDRFIDSGVIPTHPDIIAGFRKLGKCLEKTKLAVDDVFGSGKVLVILGGLNKLPSNYVNSRKLSISPPEDVLKVLRGTSTASVDYTKYIDGVGVHIYPPVVLSSTTSLQDQIKADVVDVMTSVGKGLPAGSKMPMWITEFGFSTSAFLNIDSSGNRRKDCLSYLVRSLFAPELSWVRWNRSYVYSFDDLGDHFQLFNVTSTNPVAGVLLPSADVIPHFDNNAFSDVDEFAPWFPGDVGTAVGPYSVSVSWPQAVDTGGSGLKTYIVDVSSDSLGSFVPGWQGHRVTPTTGTVQLLIAQLADDTRYTVRIRAEDEAGNQSDPILFSIYFHYNLNLSNPNLYFGNSPSNLTYQLNTNGFTCYCSDVERVDTHSYRFTICNPSLNLSNPLTPYFCITGIGNGTTGITTHPFTMTRLPIYYGW
jgi:hypothetical protein